MLPPKSPKLSPSSSRLPLYLVFLAVSLLFLVVNLVCALLVKMTAADVKTIVLVRVTINDSLFVLCAVSLSICLYKVAKMSMANIYLESKVLFSTSEKYTQVNPGVVDHNETTITNSLCRGRRCVR